MREPSRTEAAKPPHTFALVDEIFIVGIRVRNRFYQLIGKTGYRQKSEVIVTSIGTTGYFEN